MKSAVLHHPGGPEAFSIEQRAIPVPADSEVLVHIKAFGLNRSELMTRKGLSPNVVFPRVLGIECVGEIEDDPRGQWKPGQKVAAFMGGMGRDFDGSYAEYAVLPRSIVMPFESHLSWTELGALPEMFQTVYGSLHASLKIQSSETILIRGGTSSIGMLAIQLAKLQGLQVIATTRSADKYNILLEQGADHVLIDDGHLMTSLKELIPGGVDKVLELVGTSTLPDSLKCAKPGGIVCMTGMLSETWSIADFAPMDFIPATVCLTVYDSGQIRIGRPEFQNFIRQIEAGKLRIAINRRFSLEEITMAHELMENNSGAGKIVITT
ncbi:MAG: zinc-binding alcohol dehydrogenase family protein [Daejeonella sp.]|uniref:zinc-binding alcohol dehydrogenase family protein n=1 Tax=Daejeonella sp. TaxID=2805397 RepID=UPI003C76F6D9